MLNKKWPQKKHDTMPDHSNNYTDSDDSELFWKNLTQYSIPTLIGVPHELFPHRLPGI
jgi:hypothetical protein